MTDTPKPKQAREWRAEDLGYDGWYIVDGHGNHPKNPSLFVESAAYEQAIKERDDILKRYRAIELANKEMSRNDHVHFGSLLQERDHWRALAKKMAAGEA